MLTTLDQLATSALRLADLENAAVRFPTGVAGSEVYSYCSRAIQRVYGEIIAVEDRPHFVTEANLQVSAVPPFGQPYLWSLPVDFLQIMSLAWACNSLGPWQRIEPYEEPERAALLTPGSFGGIHPLKYGFAGAPSGFTQGTIPTAMSIEVLPPPSMGSWLKLRYVPTPNPLVNPTDTIFPGVLGHEDAVATYAAILMRRKDDLETTALEADFQTHLDRIRTVARRRDRSQPPKVQLVRNWGHLFGHRRFGR